MLQIFLILLIAVFGQEMDTEPICEEGTTLIDGVCKVDYPLNCDPSDPYDFECGVADVDVDMTGGLGVKFTIFVVTIPISIITVGVIIWMRKKK